MMSKSFAPTIYQPDNDGHKKIGINKSYLLSIDGLVRLTLIVKLINLKLVFNFNLKSKFQSVLFYLAIPI